MPPRQTLLRGLLTALLLLPNLAVACEGPAGSAWREAVLKRLNAARQAAGHCASGVAPPLRWAVQLEPIAQAQAQRNAARGQLSHEAEAGVGLGPRARSAGYRFQYLAENLAFGQDSTEELLQDWLLSAKHCANLMHQRVSEVALACVRDAERRPWWVLVLGHPQPVALAQADQAAHPAQPAALPAQASAPLAPQVQAQVQAQAQVQVQALLR